MYAKGCSILQQEYNPDVKKCQSCVFVCAGECQQSWLKCPVRCGVVVVYIFFFLIPSLSVSSEHACAVLLQHLNTNPSLTFSFLPPILPPSLSIPPSFFSNSHARATHSRRHSYQTLSPLSLNVAYIFKTPTRNHFMSFFFFLQFCIPQLVLSIFLPRITPPSILPFCLPLLPIF